MKTEDIDRRIGMPDIDAEWKKFEQEVICTSPARVGFHLSRAAAIVIVVLGVSLTALASAYLLRVAPARKAPQQTVVAVPDTVCSVEAEPDTVFVFDNVEMESIARTLGDYYGLEPQFRDEKAKHVRLYARIAKSESIDEVTALLNNFRKVKMTVRDGHLIIESGSQAAR